MCFWYLPNQYMTGEHIYVHSTNRSDIMDIALLQSKGRNSFHYKKKSIRRVRSLAH